MLNVTHILLWRHCDSTSFTVILVGGGVQLEDEQVREQFSKYQK